MVGVPQVGLFGRETLEHERCFVVLTSLVAPHGDLLVLTVLGLLRLNWIS